MSRPPTDKPGTSAAPATRPATAVSADVSAEAAYDEIQEAYDEVSHVIACMSGASRKGVWAPTGTIRAFACMGGVELDFRQADLLDETDVYVFALMGGVSILIPPGVEVDCNGLGIMGGFSGPGDTQDPDAPLIRVRGFALMGGVEVKVKKLPLSKRLLGS